MIRKSGYRFSEGIMLEQNVRCDAAQSDCITLRQEVDGLEKLVYETRNSSPRR